ncbi:MAG TPA: hypothetical protein VFA23_05520 [Dongiaceae bacterium]|nr:hypothetical protein [Dongiaceae bacterium]
MTFTTLILICATSLAVEDCGPETATDVIRGADASSVYGCGFASQALLAGTALAPALGRDHYMKTVCVAKEAAPATARAPR